MFAVWYHATSTRILVKQHTAQKDKIAIICRLNFYVCVEKYFIDKFLPFTG